jgi:hypothetical protein
MALAIVYDLQENVAEKGSVYLIFLNPILRSEFNCGAGSHMQYRIRQIVPTITSPIFPFPTPKIIPSHFHKPYL